MLLLDSRVHVADKLSAMTVSRGVCCCPQRAGAALGFYSKQAGLHLNPLV